MINNKNKFSWFTLIEVLISILLFSIIITVWFKALASISVWKVKLIQKTDIEKQAFFTSEKFFELIKKWGTIDYEEYFNRKIVWKTIQNWHYRDNTWFGNFWLWWNPGQAWIVNYWAWFYYCRSWDWQTYWDSNADVDWKLFEEWPSWDTLFKDWCKTQNNYNWVVADLNNFVNDYTWSPQRYGQYSFQFIDYNANKDNDRWDINWDWSPIIDDDDENLWTGPTVFDVWEALPELYLIDLNKKERTLFRWTIIQDPDDSINTCDTTIWWDWCLWNIEFLKLSWKDFWFKHDPSESDNFWLNDWVIDTWTVNDEFSWETDKIASEWTNNYRQPIFPNTMNVKNAKFILYPNKDNNLAWKDDSSSHSSISPFVKIYMTLTPSEKKKRAIAWKIPEIKIATTINLGSN